ncbi:hypothetical protein BJV77DRAFT_350262 [Russula vinacea]|nr:hypothetical protein BJV77DRAFT_350262 [Russula vinacea]
MYSISSNPPSPLALFSTMADRKYFSSQPVGTAPMVAGGNRNANNYPIGADGKRDWSLAYSTASTVVAFAVRALGAAVWSLARTSSACAIWKSMEPLFPVAAKHTIGLAACTARCNTPSMV